MEEEIKCPEYPDLEKDVYVMEEISEFFLKDKEVIKEHLNAIDGYDPVFGFSIVSEKMCLQVSSNNFRESYKLLRDECIKVATAIMKSNKNVTVEDVNIPIKKEPSSLTCVMEVKFKKK